MSYRKRRSGRAMSIPAGVGIGVASSLIISLVAIMVLAWLIVTEKAGQGILGYAVMGIEAIASMVGCFVSVACIKHKNLMVSIFTCIGFYLILMVSGMAFGGIHEGMIVTGIMIILGGAISQIPALIGTGSGGRKHKTPTYR